MTDELVLLLLRIGFLVLVYSLRADLFGVKVRKLPAGASASGVAASPAPAREAKPRPAAKNGSPATTSSVSKIVITSGPKAGLELPLGNESMTIGRSSESALVIRDDYTSSHHARLLLRGRFRTSTPPTEPSSSASASVARRPRSVSETPSR
jgi:hypothetical protein